MTRYDLYELVGSLTLDEAHEVVEAVLGVTLEARWSDFLGGDYSGTEVEQRTEEIRLIPNYADEEGYLLEKGVSEGAMLLYVEGSDRWDEIDSRLGADERFVQLRTKVTPDSKSE